MLIVIAGKLAFYFLTSLTCYVEGYHVIKCITWLSNSGSVLFHVAPYSCLDETKLTCLISSLPQTPLSVIFELLNIYRQLEVSVECLVD